MQLLTILHRRTFVKHVQVERFRLLSRTFFELSRNFDRGMLEILSKDHRDPFNECETCRDQIFGILTSSSRLGVNSTIRLI